MKKNAKNQKLKQEEEIKKQQKVKKAQINAVEEGAEVPIKRPRGRPRKNIVAPSPPIITQQTV